MNNKWRRSRIDIMADILRVSRDGARKTHIVYQANLNFNIVKKYLARLLEQELIEHDPPIYQATEKGILYLENFESLVRSM